jgi:FkbM family methyltransferase
MGLESATGPGHLLANKMWPFEKYFRAMAWIANHPLSQKSKARAVWKFCVTQVAARCVEGDICRPFPNETRILVSPSMKGAIHLIFPGLYDFEEMSFVMHFLRQDDLFVDAGANVGPYTVLASGVAGARSIAFEPSQATFAWLVQNVQLNHLTDRVTCMNAALGRSEGTLSFTVGLGTENHVTTGKDGGATMQVPVTTLDQSLLGLKPTLIKIDVEGFETEVLAGAHQTLENPSLCALIVERAGMGNNYGQDEQNLHKRIQDLSFVPCAYVPRERALKRMNPDVIGNIIYVRNLEAAQKRVGSAPPFRFGSSTV